MNDYIPVLTFAVGQTNSDPAATGSSSVGTAAGNTATTAVPADGSAAKTTPQEGGLFGGGYSGIIMIVAMFAAFYFLMIRPQQKKAKEHQSMLSSIDKGTEIVTNGGLIGRVTGVSDKTMTVEISEKVRVRILRSQVAGLLSAVNVEKK